MPHFKLRPLISIATPPFLVFAFHLIVDYGLGLYGVIPWLDTPMHFIGGAVIALSAHRLIAELQRMRVVGPMHWAPRVLFIVGFVMLAATAWELAEFTGDTFVYQQSYFQPSIFDTMKDLFLGFCGGLLMASIASSRNDSK